MRIFIPVLLLSFCINSPLLASDIPQNPHHLPAPHEVAPKFDYPPWTGNDAWSSTGPTGDMDTMPIQSTGTYWSTHPESHPIPMQKIQEIENH